MASSCEYYRVYFHGDQIQTVVTSSSSCVDTWISQIYQIHQHRLLNLIIGLDIEWLPCFVRGMSNPIAIIQICVGHRCLIFQILHADAIPTSLVRFLGDESFTFVGVGVKADEGKLIRDWGLRVGYTIDLADMAAQRYKASEFKGMGLKNLALALIGKEMEKPNWITLSNWNSRRLTYDQIEYATIDAYVCFLLGIRLM